MVKRSNVKRAHGTVRIIAGQWRGRRIEVAADTSVRPTPDRVRETLFNWLRDTIVGARCLDLFAGTGVLGFEALSRGAAEAWFVEQDARLVARLGTTAAALAVRPRIVARDVLAVLREPAAARFDIVFLDPPYALAVEPFIEALRPWLTAAGCVYVERPRATGLPSLPGTQWWKQSHAGAVAYGLLRTDVAAA